MMKLPTKDECDGIVISCDAFYRIDRVVEGCNVRIYDYRLATISHFTDYNAFELRGICFVEQPDGTWERNILLNKFFNVGETENWLYDDLKDKKIARVQNKEDGSVISFVKFPNGKVRAKSKTSFDSPQAQMAQKIYDSNEKIQRAVEYSNIKGMVSIFEICSPDNQIVLEYQHTELILLQVRHPDGRYEPNPDLLGQSWKIPFAEDFPPSMHNLENLLARKEIDDSDIEGWVITFEDGQMAKIKTLKYMSLHHLIGPDAMRENMIVKAILEGHIDDVIAQLVPGTKKEKLITIDNLISNNFNHLVLEFKELRRKFFQDYREDRKKFSLMFSNKGKKPHKLFGYIMKTNKESFRDLERTAELNVTEYLLKKCRTLRDAQGYIDSLR